ncbi:YciI family protein [Aspergillus saccharolyticus JOP 1030-1]|uniref:YCII-related domain-containing protein n=1 Tax=Aspergillus saccharolyticus JOP 1030-1 TaxID=1450539 RepID=A0A318Z7Y4_9EURO|nr:hypothetical protein BP01DRAFT_417956 [Aspergillus saccharolyticus JOP 1030-1]PYH42527.1 hypothetical protein BP01DRAFT_417956 [Aspergillus saccharolyticus JOP 1030-1]
MSFSRLARVLPSSSSGIPRYLGLRTMATAPPKKREWLCILPDKPNVQDLRLKVRPTHFAELPPLIEAGKMVVGGAMVDAHPEEGKPLSFRGSMIVVTGETLEEVHQLISSDIYAKSGVWDLEKAQVIPFISAVREPLNKD